MERFLPKLILHIGLSKTGSSAIQSWLSRHSKHLSRQGVHYSDLAPTAKNFEITSGNGMLLYRACAAGKLLDVKQVIKDDYLGPGDTALISSEFLQQLPKERLQVLKAAIRDLNLEVEILCYVRSAYELHYSNYLQGIKRHGYKSRFEDTGGGSYSEQTAFLRNYFQVFDDKLRVFNYDVERGDIIASFLNAAGINPSIFPDDRSRRVNRSLTVKEAEVLRQMNILHDGEFSTELSDHLIMADPEKPTETFYSAQVVERVRNAASANIDWINETFLRASRHRLEVVQPRHTPSPAREPISKEDLVPVVEWCLQYPALFSGKTFTFIQFLGDLSEYLHKYDSAMAEAIRRRRDRLSRFVMQRSGIGETEKSPRSWLRWLDVFPSRISGFVDYIGEDGVRGWAANRLSKNPVLINVFVKDKLLARTVANLPRPDIKRKGVVSNHRCGFELSFNPPVKDITEIVIDPDGTGETLRLGKQPRERLGKSVSQ